MSANLSQTESSERSFHPVLPIASCTRWLQAQFPNRPLKGLTRFARLLNRLLPAYKGPIRFSGNVRMFIDSAQPAERWLLFSGNYQPALTAVLKQHVPPGGCCLDIGANLGFYTLKFAEWVGRTGHVAAFEANPAMVDRIRSNVSLNQFSQVEVVSAAVHNQSGQLDFYVSRSPGKSSVNQLNDALEKVTVPAITIDDYISEQDWPRLDVIKMDIEGNDCNALLGAKQTLSRYRPFLVFEYKATTPSQIAQEVFSFLVTLNYQLWSLLPSGKMATFDKQAVGINHTDVICVPVRV